MVGPSICGQASSKRCSFKGDSNFPDEEIAESVFLFVLHCSVSYFSLLHFRYFTLFYPKHFIIAAYLMQNPVQMFTIRIGNKNLSETIPSHQFHNLLYTRSIQFVKNIIQQQQWNRAARTFQKIELCQFKCYKIRFILPLRTFSFIGNSPNSMFNSSL